MKQELEVTRRIQASFLPECCPQIAGWEVAAVWRGVPAALLMALSRTLVRTTAIDVRAPATAIAPANDLILADVRTGLLVMLLYTVVQPDSVESPYVNAGHAPALVVRTADGSIEELRVPRIAFGLLPELEYEDNTACLEPEGALYPHSDGATEATNTGMEMFGVERLRDVLKSRRQLPTAHLASAINEAVEAIVGDAAQFDDVTLLVVKREK